MKAQRVKNAVIVPAGAKGGFVVQAAAAPIRPQLRAEVEACYRLFIGALLDVTDNLVDGKRSYVAPPSVVRYDGDDPYLVVAADKGTATFSDVANEIALRARLLARRRVRVGRRARLRPQGDGHHRPRRVGVGAPPLPPPRHRSRPRRLHGRRHRRHVGRRVRQRRCCCRSTSSSSPRSTTATCSSIPTPTPRASFAERKRLFDAAPLVVGRLRPDARSPPGGGVYAAHAEVDPDHARGAGPARRSPTTSTSLTPAELIHAILRAPVDLLYNGGIGTYVKARAETHADVGDKANDAVRVDGHELRCRVRRRGRQPRLHPGRPRRVRAHRRPHQHRRDRQQRGRRHLRPRGEHQDPARRRGARRRDRRDRPQRAAREHDRRGRGARAARQLPPEPRARQRARPGRPRWKRCTRASCTRSKRRGHLDRDGRAPAQRRAARRTPQRRPRPDRARARGAARVREDHARGGAARVASCPTTPTSCPSSCAPSRPRCASASSTGSARTRCAARSPRPRS